MKKIKVEIVQPKVDNKHCDSFWYNGQIAVVETDHGTYSLEAVGDIRVMFEVNGDWYNNSRAVDEAWDRRLTDKNLNELNDHDGWGNNNWFEVVCIKQDNSVQDVIGDVAYDYDEAIEMLKTYVEERIYA